MAILAARRQTKEFERFALEDVYREDPSSANDNLPVFDRLPRSEADVAACVTAWRAELRRLAKQDQNAVWRRALKQARYLRALVSYGFGKPAVDASLQLLSLFKDEGDLRAYIGENDHALDNELGKSWHRRAQLTINAEDAKTAEMAFQRAILGAPDDDAIRVRYQLNSCESLRTRFSIESDPKYLNKAIAILIDLKIDINSVPDGPRAAEILGLAYADRHQAGDLEHAITLLEEVSIIYINHNWSDNYLVAQNSLGTCYRDAHRYDDAINVYTGALDALRDFRQKNREKELSVDAGLLKHNIGDAYIGKTDYDRAIEYLTEAVSLRGGPSTPNGAHSGILLGGAHIGRGAKAVEANIYLHYAYIDLKIAQQILDDCLSNVSSRDVPAAKGLIAEAERHLSEFPRTFGNSNNISDNLEGLGNSGGMTARDLIMAQILSALVPVMDHAGIPARERPTWLENIAQSLRRDGLQLPRDVARRGAGDTVAATAMNEARPETRGAAQLPEPLPTRAPELYRDRNIRGEFGRRETIVEFLERVYRPWIDVRVAALTRPDLRRLDPDAEMALRNWLRDPQHRLPDRIAVPTRTEVVQTKLDDPNRVRAARNLVRAYDRQQTRVRS